MIEHRAASRAAMLALEGTSCVALRSRRLARLVSGIFEEALRNHPITVAQFTLLGATILEGPISPARLSRLLDLEKSTLSRNLKLLVARGFVRLAASAKGAGQVVAVTSRGERALIDAMPAWRDAQARALSAMGQGVLGRLDSMIAALGREVRHRGVRRDSTAQRGSP